MRYASIFATILIVWIAVIFISLLSDSTDTVLGLYRLTIGFTLALFIFGFWRRG